MSEPEWSRRLKKYGEIPSAKDALEMAKQSEHSRYVKAVALKLKELGYKILSVEHPEASKLQDVSEDDLRYRISPSLGLSYGDIARHDVVAQTPQGDLVIVEVFRQDQIVEARKKARKVILVILGLDSGENVEVWGRKELEKYLTSRI